MKYPRANAGDKAFFSAGLHNDTIEVVEWARGQMGLTGTGGTGANSNFTRIVNDTGADVAEWDILGITTTIPISPSDDLDAFRKFRILQGIHPNLTHSGKFAIALEPIAAGEVGVCAVAGITAARVQLTTGGMDCADIDTTDSTRLLESVTGARILWRETGSSGLKWAIVRLDGTSSPRRCTCQAVSDNPDGMTGNYDVNNVKGITFYGLLPPLASESTAMEVSNPDGWAWSTANKMRIEFNYTTGLWEVTFAQCPA